MGGFLLVLLALVGLAACDDVTVPRFCVNKDALRIFGKRSSCVDALNTTIDELVHSRADLKVVACACIFFVSVFEFVSAPGAKYISSCSSGHQPQESARPGSNTSPPRENTRPDTNTRHLFAGSHVILPWRTSTTTRNFPATPSPMSAVTCARPWTGRRHCW